MGSRERARAERPRYGWVAPTALRAFSGPGAYLDGVVLEPRRLDLVDRPVSIGNGGSYRL
jgi:hypothetical protein